MRSYCLTPPPLLVADESVLRSLARLRSADGIVTLLRRGQLSKRWILLSAVHRAAAERVPAAAEESGLAEVSARLAQLRTETPEVWERALLDPCLAARARGCLRVLRGADISAPAPRHRAPVVEALRSLARVVDEALLRAAELTARPLPDIPGWAMTIDDRRPDGDPFGDRLMGPLPPREEAEWHTELTAAWRLLTRAAPALAGTVAAHVHWIMPLPAAADGQRVSASARESYGTVAISRPHDPVLMAETVVHEALHVQLYALLDIARLCEPEGGKDFRVPWHSEPRSAEAALQGAYAHLGMAQYWIALLQREAEDPEVRAHDAERIHAWYDARTRTVLLSLLDSGQLTTDGELFAEAMRDLLDSW